MKTKISEPENKKRIILTAAAILFFAAAAVCVFLLASKAFSDRADAPGDPGARLSVMFFNAGRGDSALVSFPDGSRTLIDMGTFDDGARLRAYFDVYGVGYIDRLIITHPHSDHYGGGEEILKSVRFGRAYLSPCESDEPAYRRVLEGLESTGCRTEYACAGNVISAGGAQIVFLSPEGRFENVNDMSVAVKIIYGGVSFLFTGDAESAAELDMVKRCGDRLRADVLKLGHHGSATSSTEAFLDAVRPSVAVVSCEKNGTYGFPAPEIVKRLADRGVTLFANHERDIGIELGTDGEKLFILN
ncbi:MAG: MBL fold metallo-hydrolase [Clostridia bacterium]|nr:MBL fold metallo-hydrolase [Clostridia bacterium]